MDSTVTFLGGNGSLRMNDTVVRQWNTFPPSSALLRTAGPCSWAGVGPERPREVGRGTLRSLRLRLRGRVRPDHPQLVRRRGVTATVQHTDARRSVPAALALPAGPPAGAVRSRARSRRCAALRHFLSVLRGIGVGRSRRVFARVVVAVKGRFGGVGAARLESPEFRASIPATLCFGASGPGRRRAYLGLTPPRPPPSEAMPRATLRALENPTSVLVSTGRRISLATMLRSATKAKSRVGADRAGDLVLPPPLPPRPRGTRPPPVPGAIARTLAPFCRKHGITRLEVFGSVARGDATVGSDVDLIATFPEHPGLEIVTIEEECEQLLGVPVHLLTFEAVEDMTNPYRKETIQRDRRTIYAA